MGATALAGTSVSASVAASAALSSSIKQRTMCFVLIALLARALHVMGLCTSLVQVALLAGLGGGICQCISGVSAHAGLSSHEPSLSSSKGDRTCAGSSQRRIAEPRLDDPMFWPLVTPHVEEEEATTPLASLTAQYIGCGMLDLLALL